MKKKILSALIIVTAAVIVISFFMPWARVSISAMGVSKELTGKVDSTLKDTPFAGKVVNKLQEVTDTLSSIGDIKLKTRVSGYSIPVLVNEKSSKVAISLMQILFKNTKDLDIKSYLVYLLPICGIFCAIAGILGYKNKIYILAIIIVSGVISIIGLYNLYTAHLENVAVEITIMDGLWLTMYGFLFIFLVGITWIALDRK